VATQLKVWRYFYQLDAIIASARCVWCGCRADITALLQCTSRLLLYCCESLSQLMDPCEADGDICLIHNYCCCLLAALAVVGAALDSLYRLLLHLRLLQLQQQQQQQQQNNYYHYHYRLLLHLCLSQQQLLLLLLHLVLVYRPFSALILLVG